MVHTVTSASEFNEAVASGAVVVDFFATWCGPCKMVAPLLEKLEPKFESIKFLKIDIEEVPEIASEYQVSAVPTFLYFKDGKVVNVVRGAAPAKIQQGLEELK